MHLQPPEIKTTIVTHARQSLKILISPDNSNSRYNTHSGIVVQTRREDKHGSHSWFILFIVRNGCKNIMFITRTPKSSPPNTIIWSQSSERWLNWRSSPTTRTGTEPNLRKVTVTSYPLHKRAEKTSGKWLVIWYLVEGQVTCSLLMERLSAAHSTPTYLNFEEKWNHTGNTHYSKRLTGSTWWNLYSDCEYQQYSPWRWQPPAALQTSE